MTISFSPVIRVSRILKGRLTVANCHEIILVLSIRWLLSLAEHLPYVRVPGGGSNTLVWYFNPANPDKYQIYLFNISMLPILAGISLMAAFTTMFFHLRVPPTSVGVGNNHTLNCSDTVQIVPPSPRTTLSVCPFARPILLAIGITYWAFGNKCIFFFDSIDSF